MKYIIKEQKISILRILCQSIYLLLLLGAVISKNIIFIFAIVCAVFIGPIFCGWLCFFGFYQDILRYIGKLLKKDPFKIDANIHKYLRFSRYIILIGITTIGGIFTFPDEMKHSLFQAIQGHLSLNVAFFAVITLGVMSLFTKRFYCKYLCSFGAEQGLLSLIRPVTIKRDEKKCINCKTCTNECTMQINVHSSLNIADPNCINCFRCVEVCPQKCLSLGIRNYFKP